MRLHTPAVSGGPAGLPPHLRRSDGLSAQSLLPAWGVTISVPLLLPLKPQPQPASPQATVRRIAAVTADTGLNDAAGKPKGAVTASVAAGGLVGATAGTLGAAGLLQRARLGLCMCSGAASGSVTGHSRTL